MGLYNGKTTTTMPLACSDPDSVDGETSGARFLKNLRCNPRRNPMLT